MKVFPIPISDITEVEIIGRETENIGKFDLSVYDALGMKVLSKVMNDRQGQIDLGALRPGLYFIEVFAEGVRLRERVLKIR